jgi:hypothetical protein
MELVVSDDVGRRREHFCDGSGVAGGVDEGLIVRAAFPRRGGARPDRIFGGGDRGQRFVFDLDRLGGIFGLLQRLGDDESDGIAEIAHPIAGQERLRRGEGRAAVAPLARRHRALGAELAHLVVFAGQHQEHAGHRLGGFGGDGDDAGMTVGRAQHIAAHLSADLHVVDITPGAADEVGVFFPWDRLADAEFTHFSSSALAMVSVRSMTRRPSRLARRALAPQDDGSSQGDES